MKKVIEFNTPDGVYQLDLKLVAEHRADYYAIEVDRHKKGSQDYIEEVEYVMSDNYEGIDWLLNNTNYEDWEDVTKKINSEVNVLRKDFWTNSNDFNIIEVKE